MADAGRCPPFQSSTSSSCHHSTTSNTTHMTTDVRRLEEPAAHNPRIRVTRAFSEIEEAATLQQLEELLVSTSTRTLDVQRLVSSPTRLSHVTLDRSGLLTRPLAPPTSPASLPRPGMAPAVPASRTIRRHPLTNSHDHGSVVTGSPLFTAWGGPSSLPPRVSSAEQDDAVERRRTMSNGLAQDAPGLQRKHADTVGEQQPRRDVGEWADTAARLSRRVQELELENFRLKSANDSPTAFAIEALCALQLTESDGGTAFLDVKHQRRGRLNKSQSCANGFEVTGLTVAEAAAASRRTRTRRLASAANATEPAVKLRSGYWNGTNNAKSSFSCNNLSELEHPEVVLEKLRTSHPLAVAASSAANGGNTTVVPVSATTGAHEASRKSDSFQCTSSETEEDVAIMRKQHAALQKSLKNPSAMARQSSSSVELRLDEIFDETENRITSPRSYFEARLRTGGFSLSSTAPSALKSGKRTNVGDIRIWVGTWNMGAADPFDDGKGIIDEQRSATMLQNFLPQGYQLYVLGVQEGVSENVYHAVEAYLNRNEQETRYYRMELKNGNFMVNHRNQPPDAVIDAVHGRGDGAFVGTKFTGMAVFYCANIEDKIKLIRAGAHKFKLTSGSKGGVAVALMINHTTIVFVNCHLDARNDTYRREQIRNLNASLGRIMGHYSFDLTEQFHHVVWMGDMNYRIVFLDPQMVLHMLEEGRNLELHDKFDGLLNDRRNGGVFEGFTEPHKFPDFYPTYKKFPKRGIVNEKLPLWPSLVWRVLYKEPFYKGGKVKKRVPGWCDRILIHSLLVGDSKLIPEKVLDPTSLEGSPGFIDNYRSVNHGDGMDVSDHSPVYGTFVLGFPQHDCDVFTSDSARTLSHRNLRSLSTVANIAGDRYSNSVGGSYFDQARVVRQMKAQKRLVSTVLRVFNMELSWNDNVVVPKKTRIVAPLVAEDAKQCDVIGERCQGSNGLNLSLNAVIQHTRPLEQLHMLVWVKNESINGHCTLSLKRIARQEEGGEVKFRVPLYNDSMRVHLDGHPLLVVFSVRSKTFAK